MLPTTTESTRPWFEAASSAYSFPVSSLSPLLLETKVAIFFDWVTGWLGYFQVACRLAGQYGCLSGLKHMKLQRSFFDFQPARISLIYNSLGSQKKRLWAAFLWPPRLQSFPHPSLCICLVLYWWTNDQPQLKRRSTGKRWTIFCDRTLKLSE